MLFGFDDVISKPDFRYNSETTNKNLEWSENSSNDLLEEQKNWSSAESPADGASSAPAVN